MVRQDGFLAALSEGQRRLKQPDPLGALPYLLRATSPEAPHNEQTDAHMALARLRVALGQDLLALTHFRGVLALRPGQMETRLLLGRAFVRLGWPDLALRVFDSLTPPEGGGWRALEQRARRDLAEARRDARQAIAALRRGVGVPPGTEEALVRALLRAGRLGPAGRLLHALSPTPERQWLCAALRLRCQEGVADPALRRALRPPGDAAPALQREAAELLLSLGEAKAAGRVLEGAQPGSAGQELQARILLVQGRYPEFVAWCEADFAQRPERVDVGRRLLSARVLAGEVPVWAEPDPVDRALPTLSLLQFWPDADPPAAVRAAMDSWVHHHPGVVPVRFDRHRARDFILEHHGDKLARLFDVMRNPALQANILALSYLSLHGGLWVAPSVLCRRPLDEVLTRLGRFGLVTCLAGDLPYHASPELLVAPPASPVMAAIQEAQIRLAQRLARDASALRQWETLSPWLVTRVAAGMPGRVALLAPDYWRRFAAEATPAAA